MLFIADSFHRRINDIRCYITACYKSPSVVELPLEKGFYRYAVITADTMMTDKNVSWGREASCICSSHGALACRNGSLERDLDGRGDEHDCDDLNKISGQEGYNAGSK